MIVDEIKIGDHKYYSEKFVIEMLSNMLGIDKSRIVLQQPSETEMGLLLSVPQIMYIVKRYFEHYGLVVESPQVFMERLDKLIVSINQESNDFPELN